jgi:hypothetical protein
VPQPGQKSLSSGLGRPQLEQKTSAFNDAPQRPQKAASSAAGFWHLGHRTLSQP